MTAISNEPDLNNSEIELQGNHEFVINRGDFKDQRKTSYVNPLFNRIYECIY